MMTTKKFVKRIACIDLDAFFVEVALKAHPEMRGKPVVVGGEPQGRGVVCSASYEARQLGIKAGMPISRALQICQSLSILPIPSTVTEFSHLVREILKKWCPVVDTASIDEFFLDFTGCDRLYPSNLDLAENLCREIDNKLGLPATIGFATNKLVAKIASDTAKPRGIFVIPPNSETKFLAQLPVAKIPGVGHKTEKLLHSLGITFVGEILRVSRQIWRSILGKAGEILYENACGICRSPVIADEEKHRQKSLSREKTLQISSSSVEFLVSFLSKLCERVTFELRQFKLKCGGVTVKIRYDDFSVTTKSKRIQHTDDDQVIFTTAKELFLTLYKKCLKVRLVGVSLDNLHSGEFVMSFDDLLESTPKRKLPFIIDSIRCRFGFDKILRARSLHPELSKHNKLN